VHARHAAGDTLNAKKTCGQRVSRTPNRTTSVRWPLTAGFYSVAPACSPLTMDNYSARRPNNPTPCRACTQRDETTGWDNFHTVEDIICYTRQVEPEYVRIQPPRGHLSGPRSHCPCRGFELLKFTKMLESLEPSKRLNRTL
jgi:hypothetical protein